MIYNFNISYISNEFKKYTSVQIIKILLLIPHPNQNFQGSNNNRFELGMSYLRHNMSFSNTTPNGSSIRLRKKKESLFQE